MDRLLIVGSREWDNWDLLRNTLEQSFNLDVQMITAGTRGAEKMSGYIWAEWGGDSREYAPNWDLHGKSAGYRRVEGLILARPVRVIAFLNGEDPMVEHAIAYAKEKGIPVTVVQYVENNSNTGDTSKPAEATATATPPVF